MSSVAEPERITADYASGAVRIRLMAPAADPARTERTRDRRRAVPRRLIHVCHRAQKARQLEIVPGQRVYRANITGAVSLCLSSWRVAHGSFSARVAGSSQGDRSKFRSSVIHF